MTQNRKLLKKSQEKRENDGNQHFLLSPQFFSTLSQTEIIIVATLNLSSANPFNLYQTKILSSGKELTGFYHGVLIISHDISQNFSHITFAICKLFHFGYVCYLMKI